VSARGDSITWLHEGKSGELHEENSSGPGGSAGVRAMQVLQVSVSPVSGFILALHPAQHVRGADCLLGTLAQADDVGHMPNAAWHGQHGTTSRAGWGSHTVHQQPLADSSVLVRHHSHCIASVSMHHTAPNTALRLLDIAAYSHVSVWVLQCVIDS